MHQNTAMVAEHKIASVNNRIQRYTSEVEGFNKDKVMTWIHAREASHTLGRYLFLEALAGDKVGSVAFCARTTGSSFQRQMPLRTSIWPDFISSHIFSIATDKDGSSNAR